MASGALPDSGRSRAATITSGDFAAARSTTHRTPAANPTQTISGTTTQRSIRAGYLTDLLGDRAVGRERRLREDAHAIFHQPAFQRAALAVGRLRTTRRSLSACREARPAGFRWRLAKTYARMIEAWICRSAASCRRWRRTGDPQHDRRFHQRQRRRAVRRYMAVHRQEDGTAGRRPAHSGDRRAGRDTFRRPAPESGRDHDGLAADAARSGGAAARSGLSARRHQPAAGAHAERAPVPRKLFWRYKANAQRAMRDGD